MNIKYYYSLIKPGIVYGNMMTVTAGFFLGTKGAVNYPLLFATLLGISLVIASGCLLNNYIDRDVDACMERTKRRMLAWGLVPVKFAIAFAICLGALGALTLLSFTNLLATGTALFGLFVYVVLYSLWLKRRSVYATWVGSIAGAVPPVVGYAAASTRIDAGALFLFAMLSFWQMPHAFAIAIRRLEDYRAALLPVLPLKNGVRGTKIQMLLFVIAFSVATLMLWVLGYVGYGYLLAASVLCLAWFGISLAGYWARDDKQWARMMFLSSITVLLLLCIAISVGAITQM
jgi:heme o synthase